MLGNSGYSNIGFRSESSIKELEIYQKGETANHYIIKDAYRIIKRFDRILSEPKTLHLDKPDEGTYLKIILDELRERKLTTSQIKTTKIALEKILNHIQISDDEIRIGLEFFKEISKKCLEYSTEKNYP